MYLRPFIGTFCGSAIGVLAIVIWMITFQPHGGVELSCYLFPFSRLVLDRLYPAESVPAPVWYIAALAQ